MAVIASLQNANKIYKTGDTTITALAETTLDINSGELNFALIQQQYKNGRLLIEEISKADYAVQLAKNEYLNAAYNYLLAEIQMEYEQAK